MLRSTLAVVSRQLDWRSIPPVWPDALTTGSAPWPLATDQTEEFNRQTLVTTGQKLGQCHEICLENGDDIPFVTRRSTTSSIAC